MPANLENSAVATGLEKVSFHSQSQRKAMPKNTQTTAQLQSSYTLVMLKILQARLQQYMNHELPLFKLVLEKAEEPEIKLPTSSGSKKKARQFQKNIDFCFIDYAKVFDCVDDNKLWKILKEMGIPDHLTCLLRNLYAGQEAS